jgi:hypothetical protein
MKFKIRKIVFALVSLLVFGLIIFCESTVNAQVQITTPNDGEISQKTCSVEAFERTKNGKEVIGKTKIPLSLSGVTVEKDQYIQPRESEKDKRVLSKDVSLGDTIILTVKNLKNAVDNDKQFSIDQLVLQLNRYSFNGIHGTYLSPDQLVFQLNYSEESRNSWIKVIGSSWDLYHINVPVTLGCIDGAAIPVLKSTDNLLTINLWHPSRGLIAILPIGLLVFVLCTKEFRDALRSTGVTKNRVFSLARFQLAFWSYLIFFCFLILFAITGDYTNIISPQSMILLGISSLTTVGSSVIDTSEGKRLDAEVENYLVQLNDKYNLWQIYNGDKQIAKITSQIQEIVSQLNIIEQEKRKYNDNSSESNQKISSLNQQKKQYEDKISRLKQSIEKQKNWKRVKKQQLISLKKKMNCIEQQSENFFKDILTNPTGEINLHRYQIFIWTLVLGGIYMYMVITTFQVPAFDQNLLTLQGISSGTFLALKSREPNPQNAKDTPNLAELEEIPKPSSDISGTSSTTDAIKN